MTRPRIVFMGTPAFAVASLAALLDVGEVVAVVTQPDKPKGRGQSVSFSPVKDFALARGIPVLQPLKMKTPPFVDALRPYAPDLCVVTAYGKILPKDVLELAPLGCVNVHASLLPRFRGAAPIQWALAHGDTETGVCLMKMDEGLDTGPVFAVERLPIAADDTSASLHEKLAALGGEALKKHLPAYIRGELVPVPQSTEGMVYAPMIEKEAGQLDFKRPAAELERRLRAFTPWPGAFTSLVQGPRLKVHRMRVGTGQGVPGTVLRAGKDGIEVACQEGSVLLLEVQPEGKRVMAAGDFLLGHPFAEGSQPFAVQERVEG